MVSWIALVFSVFAFFTAFIALCVAMFVYIKGPKIKELDPDELFDLLLEQNDANILFRERPFDD
jgi:hypothetical protein